MQEYDPFGDGIGITENKWYSKKRFFNLFIKSFNKSDYIIAFVLCLVSIIISSFLTFELDNLYKLVKEISGNLISYFSISVGFSFATLVFIIDNSVKHLSENDETLIEITSLITGYILHGLFIIALLIMHYFIGALIYLNGFTYYLVNIVVLSLILSLIFVNLIIFIKIIKVVYYYSYSLINRG